MWESYVMWQAEQQMYREAENPWWYEEEEDE